MSTQEVAALIESVNNLTNTVSGKMTEIDGKVESAVNDITETITANNIVTYFVDAENGSDDNPGTADSPLKTVNRAVAVCPTGSKARIYLNRSQRHVVDSPLNFYAAFTEFFPRGYNTDLSKTYHYDDTTPVLVIEAGVNLYGSVSFGNYRQSLIVETNENTPWQGFSFYGGSTITFGRSRVVLNLPQESKPLFGADYNYLTPIKVALREADIVKTKGYLSRAGCLFSVDGATGFQYTDEVILGATKDNTPSNVPFSA